MPYPRIVISFAKYRSASAIRGIRFLLYELQLTSNDCENHKNLLMKKNQS